MARFADEVGKAMVRHRVSKAVQRRHRKGISAKISKLRHEGKPQQQAVATALNMARAGRLSARGGYRRA